MLSTLGSFTLGNARKSSTSAKFSLSPGFFVLFCFGIFHLQPNNCTEFPRKGKSSGNDPFTLRAAQGLTSSLCLDVKAVRKTQQRKGGGYWKSDEPQITFPNLSVKD